MKDILILAIETSCDETSAAIVLNGREVLSNVILSQIKVHEEFGGVVPEIASRKHVEAIIPVISKAIDEAGIKKDKIDVVAVTYGPGLIGALLVGLSAAKAMSLALRKPLVGVNHIDGHISANYIENKNLEPPFISLVVSGGHSHIVDVRDYNVYKVMGKTRDDAAGEAFDKVARILGLGYPGGPAIDREAKVGDQLAIKFPEVHFANSLDFSFSGPKTAVLNYLNTASMNDKNINIPDICASFQKAVVDILVENTVKALEISGYDKVALAGGVASNSSLRSSLESAAKIREIQFYKPSPILCTDNAAMIGCAAYYKYIEGHSDALDLNAYANLNIEIQT
jgi:N6-L-threonylcarbamoyladenine synthase